MANYASFHTPQEPKLEVLVNTDLVRAVFVGEGTSCTLVFDEKYVVSVAGTLKEIEGKLKGGTTLGFKR